VFTVSSRKLQKKKDPILKSLSFTHKNTEKSLRNTKNSKKLNKNAKNPKF
jgi:hypothetical protein